tara:strand:- start:7 stop:189 length:183 start_codon:yes stop_codon:yes gene_type:complete
MGSEAKWPICIGCLPKADSQQPAPKMHKARERRSSWAVILVREAVSPGVIGTDKQLAQRA